MASVCVIFIFIKFVNSKHSIISSVVQFLDNIDEITGTELWRMLLLHLD